VTQAGDSKLVPATPAGSLSRVRRLSRSADSQERPVTRVVVDVMLKPEILDPQGQAILGALGRLGYSGISSVRQGKHFEVDLDGPADDAALERIRELARTLLSNPVIEDFVVYAE